MNPGRVFGEVLESHEFQSSDTVNPAMKLNRFPAYL
jgi:hypothetical protein